MAERSAKKRKASREKRTIKIQVEDPGTIGNPVVVSFPGGLPQSMQKESSEVTHPKFLWQKINEKSTFGRRIIGQDKHCVYSSKCKGLAYDDRRTKLCVGVYNKKRGVVVIREAASKGTVFSLEQTVPAYLERNGNANSGLGRATMEYTKVYEDFGSSKKRKVIKSQAANRFDVNDVVGVDGEGASAVMELVMKGESMSESNRKALKNDNDNGITASTAVEASLEAARRDFLPAYDIHAVKPHQVYNAKEIAGDMAWTRVYNKVHACLHADDPASTILESILERDWSDSVVKLVKEINPDSKHAGHRYTCAILANWIIKFYNGNQKRRQMPPPNETKSSYFGIPIEVACRWVKLFTTSFNDDRGKLSYAMSKSNKDKCILHALLQFMMAHGNSMKIGDLKPIAMDMKVTVAECGQLLRLAGCTITKKGPIYSAVLKTPLTFPPPPRGGGRRGR